MQTSSVEFTITDRLVADVHRSCRSLQEVVDAELSEAAAAARVNDVARCIALLSRVEDMLQARTVSLQALTAATEA